MTSSILDTPVKELNPIDGLAVLDEYYNLGDGSKVELPGNVAGFLQSMRRTYPASSPELRALYGDLMYGRNWKKEAFQEFRRSMALEVLLDSANQNLSTLMKYRVPSFESGIGMGRGSSVSYRSSSGTFEGSHQHTSRSNLKADDTFSRNRHRVLKMAIAGTEKSPEMMKILVKRYADLLDTSPAREADALKITGNTKEALHLLEEQVLAKWKKMRGSDDGNGDRKNPAYCLSLFRKFFVFLIQEKQYLKVAVILKKTESVLGRDTITENMKSGSPYHRDWQYLENKLLDPVRIPDRWIRERTSPLTEEQKKQFPELIKQLGAKEFPQRRNALRTRKQYSGRVLLLRKEKYPDAEGADRKKRLRELIRHHLQNVAETSTPKDNENGDPNRE